MDKLPWQYKRQDNLKIYHIPTYFIIEASCKNSILSFKEAFSLTVWNRWWGGHNNYIELHKQRPAMDLSKFSVKKTKTFKLIGVLISKERVSEEQKLGYYN